MPPQDRTVTATQVAREEEAEYKVGLHELDGTLFVRMARLIRMDAGGGTRRTLGRRRVLLET